MQIDHFDFILTSILGPGLEEIALSSLSLFLILWNGTLVLIWHLPKNVLGISEFLAIFSAVKGVISM